MTGMSHEPGYYIMSKDAVEEHGEFGEPLSVVEYLRRLDSRGDLPLDMTVYGLDTYLDVSENKDETADFIRGVLLDSVNYLFNQQPVVQFVVDEVEHWQGPVLPFEDGDVRLRDIFGGSLSQEGSGEYSGELNVQT